MIKCCGLCRYSYCSDTFDVSGFDCKKCKVLKITELDKIHPLCKNEFKLSLRRIIYYWSLHE
jgi:hypothetical protein